MTALRRGRFQRGVDLAVCVAFLLAIAAPVAWAWLGPPQFDPSLENRPIAPFPPLRVRRLTVFPSAFERWFGDRFGFRRDLIRAQSLVKLRAGVSPSPLVVVGREGWLFYRGERAVEQFQRTSPLTQDELEAWCLRLERRRSWLSDRGIRYLFALAPSKETIYPEHMPDRLRRGVRPAQPSRREQLVAYLRARSRVDVVDLASSLEAAREGVRVYQRTDTHWNDRGAFAAYRAVAGQLAAWFPAVVPLSRADLVETEAVTLGGDLAGMMNLRHELPEHALLAAPRAPRALERDPGVAVTPDMPPHTVPRARGVDGGTLPRALVLRDSFAEAMIPFLSENLDRALYLFTHDLDPVVVGRERPDVVVEIMLERFLMAAPFENRPELSASPGDAPR